MSNKKESWVGGHGDLQSIPSLKSKSTNPSTLTIEDVNLIRDTIKESFSPRFDAIDKQNISFQTQLTRISQEQLNLSNNMVGWDRCANLREATDRKFDQMFQSERKSNGEKFKEHDDKFEVVFGKLDKCIEVCTEFEATKGGVVTDAALARAEVRVTEAAAIKDGDVLSEIKELRKEVAANKRDTDSQFLTWEKRFAIFDFSLGVPSWIRRNWLTIIVILSILGAMFSVVDWNIRDIQWATHPPVNVMVGQ
jgi:hypothetical protein